MTQILKANQVSTETAVKLSLNSQSSPQKNATNSGTAPLPSAKVVDSTEHYAIIEVTCQCGQINQVRCDF
ncbi:MAG: hypothetical protein KAS23_08335 [Anaerohalosphaera sp.]|nr:hypothetical protein [Anaerohalosphaera sp.]